MKQQYSFDEGVYSRRDTMGYVPKALGLPTTYAPLRYKATRRR